MHYIKYTVNRIHHNILQNTVFLNGCSAQLNLAWQGLDSIKEVS